MEENECILFFLKGEHNVLEFIMMLIAFIVIAVTIFMLEYGLYVILLVIGYAIIKKIYNDYQTKKRHDKRE